MSRNVGIQMDEVTDMRSIGRYKKFASAPMPRTGDPPPRRVHPSNLPSIEIDNLFYTQDGEDLYCALPVSQRTAFPRSLVCFEGVVLQVSLIEGTNGRSSLYTKPMAVCIPSSARVVCRNCCHS
jgi:hypothetical protein